MKDAKSLLFYFSIVLTIYVVNYIISIIHPSAKGNDPIFWWSGQCVIALFLLGYVRFSWKSNMAELLKRVRFAIPLALIVSIFTIIMRFDSFIGMTAGLFTFILLLFKTSNCKQHFSVIMTLALASVIMLKFLQILFPADGGQMTYPLLRSTLLLACCLPILNFLSLYMSKLLKAETPALRPILVRTVKFSIVVSLFFAIFLILSDIGDERGISLPIQILVSSLLSIFFLVICYIFDLSLIERKKKPKNIINELHEELEDFYLEEKAKIKK